MTCRVVGRLFVLPLPSHPSEYIMWSYIFLIVVDAIWIYTHTTKGSAPPLPDERCVIVFSRRASLPSQHVSLSCNIKFSFYYIIIQIRN